MGATVVSTRFQLMHFARRTIGDSLMNPARFALPIFLALVPAAYAQAAGSLLSVGCSGADVGAEIFVGDTFKGECPLDVQVQPGTVHLRVVKKVDAKLERVFEQDIRLGDGVTKKVTAVLTKRRAIVKQEPLDQQPLLKIHDAAQSGNTAAVLGSGSTQLPVSADQAKGDTKLLAPNRKTAASGNSGALFERGSAFETGTGVAKSDEQAVLWYQKAVEAGHAQAMANLAVMYRDHRGGLPKDDAKFLSLTRQAAELGNPAAMSNLGWAFMLGRGVPKSDEQAVAWLQKAVEAGEAEAMANLAMMYRDGRGGLPKDDAEFVLLCRRAAELDLPGGMFGLGWAFENGRGVPKSAEEAASWLRKGVSLYQKKIDAGDAVAMVTLANFYRAGVVGLRKDEAMYLSLIRKAAEFGNSGAMATLGYGYNSGVYGLPKDDQKAMEWEEKAAALGDAGAMSFIGSKFLYRDTQKAVEWFEKAAALGHEASMIVLGGMYMYGTSGVPRDDQKALEWYQKADALGGNNIPVKNTIKELQERMQLAQRNANAPQDVAAQNSTGQTNSGQGSSGSGVADSLLNSFAGGVMNRTADVIRSSNTSAGRIIGDTVSNLAAQAQSGGFDPSTTAGAAVTTAAGAAVMSRATGALNSASSAIVAGSGSSMANGLTSGMSTPSGGGSVGAAGGGYTKGPKGVACISGEDQDCKCPAGYRNNFVSILWATSCSCINYAASGGGCILPTPRSGASATSTGACEQEPYLGGIGDPQVDGNCQYAQKLQCNYAKSKNAQYLAQKGKVCSIENAIIQQTVKNGWSCRYCP